jgi:hypothetical protein
MARYEDYVKQESIEDEIDDAASAAQERVESAPELPARYRGKSVDELIEMHQNAEQLNSRHAQELGELRRTVNSLVDVATKKPTEAAPVKKPVTVDDIYENADESVRRVVREETSATIEELRTAAQRSEARAKLAEFKSKHPTFDADMGDPAFLDWIKASPYRVRLAVAADGGDFDAADELFGLYSEVRVKRTDTDTKKARKQKARDVSLESSSPVSPSMVESYSGAELMEKRIAARRGDAKAERWLQAHGDAIRAAYAEGRIVN